MLLFLLNNSDIYNVFVCVPHYDNVSCLRMCLYEDCLGVKNTIVQVLNLRITLRTNLYGVCVLKVFLALSSNIRIYKHFQ